MPVYMIWDWTWPVLKAFPRACFSKGPGKVFGPIELFFVNLYLKTERCIRLRFLVWGKPLFILLMLTEINQPCIRRNKIFLWASGCENFGARFSKIPKRSRMRKAITKYRSLWLQSCILPMNRGSLYTRSFKRTHFSVYRYRVKKKMALRARKVSGASRNAPQQTLTRPLKGYAYNSMSKTTNSKGMF